MNIRVYLQSIQHQATLYIDEIYMEYVTSDLHFGHANIIKYCNRPYTTSTEMDDDLVRIWNDQVTPEDITYIVGDLTMDKNHSKIDGVLESLLSRLNGNKVFILGNHDKHIEHKLNALMTRRKAGVWNVVPYYEMRHNGRKVVMFHYPMVEWNGSHRDTVLLFGHCHGGRPDLPGRLLDVGIDAHPEFKLWTLEEAIAAADANYEKTKETFVSHQTGT